MSGPSKRLEGLVRSRRIWHGGNPVLQWMASNVCTEKDSAENIKPSKGASFERIDGIVAGVMAIGRAILLHEPESNPYEERGIRTL
jgi:phage terminase large subunit-like protein